MSADTLEQAFASTARILANVSADQLDSPTPCRSWKVRDLVNHIVGGASFFAITAETGEAPSGGGAVPDFAAGDFCADFDAGAKRAVSAFRAEGAMDKMMTLPFGGRSSDVGARGLTAHHGFQRVVIEDIGFGRRREALP